MKCSMHLQHKSSFVTDALSMKGSVINTMNGEAKRNCIMRSIYCGWDVGWVIQRWTRFRLDRDT